MGGVKNLGEKVVSPETWVIIMKDEKPKLHRKKKKDRMEDAIYMRHHRGMSIDAIALELGVSRRTVQRWLISHDDDASSKKRQDTVLKDNRGRPPVYPLGTEKRVIDLKLENQKRRATTVHRLLNEELMVTNAPCPSLTTVRRWLRKHGLSSVEREGRTGYVKFARERPNDLWQVDIAGVQTVGHLGKLYLFAILDDCSRYIVAARYFRDQKGINLLRLLRDALEEYGCPNQILSDNGRQFRSVLDSLGTKYVRFLKLIGVEAIFAKPYHPQTKGKLERWFGTVKTSFLPEARYKVEENPGTFLPEFNDMLARWIHWYNNEKAHRSLPGRGAPASVYFMHPERVHKPLRVTMDWDRWFLVEGTRKVSKYNTISYKNETIQIPPGHASCKVEVLESEGRIEVYHGDECLVVHEVNLEYMDIRAKKFERMVAANGNFKYEGNDYRLGGLLSGKKVLIKELDQGRKIAVYLDNVLVEEFLKKPKKVKKRKRT